MQVVKGVNPCAVLWQQSIPLSVVFSSPPTESKTQICTSLHFLSENRLKTCWWSQIVVWCFSVTGGYHGGFSCFRHAAFKEKSFALSSWLRTYWCCRGSRFLPRPFNHVKKKKTSFVKASSQWYVIRTNMVLSIAHLQTNNSQSDVKYYNTDVLVFGLFVFWFDNSLTYKALWLALSSVIDHTAAGCKVGRINVCSYIYSWVTSPQEYKPQSLGNQLKLL